MSNGLSVVYNIIATVLALLLFKTLMMSVYIDSDTAGRIAKSERYMVLCLSVRVICSSSFGIVVSSSSSVSLFDGYSGDEEGSMRLFLPVV